MGVCVTRQTKAARPLLREHFWPVTGNPDLTSELVPINALVVRNVVDSRVVVSPSIECHVAWMSDSPCHAKAA
jgi:hypothetical protein